MQIYEVEGLYYLGGENKRHRSVTAQQMCAFVLAYAKSRFSHDAAHITSLLFSG